MFVRNVGLFLFCNIYCNNDYNYHDSGQEGHNHQDAEEDGAERNAELFGNGLPGEIWFIFLRDGIEPRGRDRELIVWTNLFYREFRVAHIPSSAEFCLVSLPVLQEDNGPDGHEYGEECCPSVVENTTDHGVRAMIRQVRVGACDCRTRPTNSSIGIIIFAADYLDRILEAK